MKRFLSITLICISLFLLCGFIKQDNSYYETTEVEHLFTHALIAFPELAFKKDNPMRNAYNQDCITKDEFIKMIKSLHKNNYALIDIHETFREENGVVTKSTFKVPKGKKALILSFDDINYDTKKCGFGMVDKLSLSTNGNIVSCTVKNNQTIESASNEFVPILDEFVKQHPDFSIRGAKGTINLTGYDGILGYRVSDKDIEKRNKEISQVRPLIKKLLKTGWNFACHSYGHYHMNKISYEQFCEEVDNWNKNIKPLLPPTPVYVYPYGEWQVFDSQGICAKHQKLIDNEFKLFCGVGLNTFYTYLPNKFHLKVLFMDRKVVDGNTLRKNPKQFTPFFNAKEIYDYKYRPN